MAERVDFRSLVEAGDLDRLMNAFTEDAVLHSPITFQPFEGRPAIRLLLEIILDVFQDFHYTDELDAADGTKALVFRTKVRDRDVEGLDLVRYADDGRICELTVMVRPRSGMEALLGEVAPRLASAQAEAS